LANPGRENKTRTEVIAIDLQTVEENNLTQNSKKQGE
jgi:hypothetical protein